jgi:hypothetical protein
MLKKRGSYEVSNCTIEIDQYKELRQYVTKKHTYQIVKCTSKIDESDEYLQYSDIAVNGRKQSQGETMGV